MNANTVFFWKNLHRKKNAKLFGIAKKAEHQADLILWCNISKLNQGKTGAVVI